MISRPSMARAELRSCLVLAALVALLLNAPSAGKAQGLVQGVQQGAQAGNKAAGPVGGVLGGAIGGVVGVFTGVLGVGKGEQAAPAAKGSAASKQAGPGETSKSGQGRQGDQAGGAAPARRAATDRRADRRQQRRQHRADQK